MFNTHVLSSTSLCATFKSNPLHDIGIKQRKLRSNTRERGYTWKRDSTWIRASACNRDWWCHFQWCNWWHHFWSCHGAGIDDVRGTSTRERDLDENGWEAIDENEIDDVISSDVIDDVTSNDVIDDITSDDIMVQGLMMSWCRDWWGKGSQLILYILLSTNKFQMSFRWV